MRHGWCSALGSFYSLRFFQENYNCRATPAERVWRVKRWYFNIVNNFRDVSEGNAKVSTTRRNGPIVVLLCARTSNCEPRVLLRRSSSIPPRSSGKDPEMAYIFPGSIRNFPSTVGFIEFLQPRTRAAFGRLFDDPTSKDRQTTRTGTTPTRRLRSWYEKRFRSMNDGPLDYVLKVEAKPIENFHDFEWCPVVWARWRRTGVVLDKTSVAFPSMSDSGTRDNGRRNFVEDARVALLWLFTRSIRREILGTSRQWSMIYPDRSANEWVEEEIVASPETDGDGETVRVESKGERNKYSIRVRLSVTTRNTVPRRLDSVVQFRAFFYPSSSSSSPRFPTFSFH